MHALVPLSNDLWTSSFVLVTGGIAVIALVLLALVIPVGRKGGPMRPLVIVGGHAIVIYVISETVMARVRGYVFWVQWEPIVSERYGELFAGVAFPLGAVLVCFLIAWLMERLNIRIRL